MSWRQRLSARSYWDSYRIFCRTILLIAILLAGQPLLAVADEMGPAVSVGRALTAAGDGDLASNIIEIDESAAKSLGIAQHSVLLVVLPAKDGPAEKAGLQPGDVIFTLNGQPTLNLAEFTAAVRRIGSGGEANLGVWRQGDRTNFPVRLGSTSHRIRLWSIEQEVEALKAVGKVFEEGRFPMIWGFIQYSLGVLYWISPEGPKEDNLEAAIAAYRSALEVLTREAFPQQWARIENYLALAYTDRVRGRRDENLGAAIRAYKAALTVLTRERFPREWAQIQNCLGLVYMDRIEGNREDNVHEAIAAYKMALTVFTKEVFPQDWARMQKHLGDAYRKTAARGDEAALAILSQTISRAPPAVATDRREASASHEAQQSERKADTIAQAAVAQTESRVPTESVEPSLQLVASTVPPAATDQKASKENTWEISIKLEAPRGESKQASRSNKASQRAALSGAKVVQTEPQQSDRQTAISSQSQKSKRQ